MDQNVKLDPIQPRFLRYRSHYKVYSLGLALLTALVAIYWVYQIFEHGGSFWQEHPHEFLFTLFFGISTGTYYAFFLRPGLKRAVQVFNDHLLMHNGKKKEVLNYSEIESVNVVCWSIFYIKMKNGFKYYFNSSLERTDYIWEGIYNARPDLISNKDFESFRVKLVQYDHQQKRNEWFYKHRLLDAFAWVILPVFFLVIAYAIQGSSVLIHHQGLYFFRLFMFALLVLLVTAFAYSLVIKKFIFDKKITEQMEEKKEKVRDLEFEGMVLQRAKIFQVLTVCFVWAFIIKFDVNLYSVSKVKEDLADFRLKKGYTILVDNRFNCTSCRYQLKDGDMVMFNRGMIGQVLAREGEMVGEVSKDDRGRTIASDNIHLVPEGHVAIKTDNGNITFVKIQDLIGKIQN